MCSVHLWDMLVSQVCFQEQRKQSFLTLTKENQSPLGLYRNPPTFFFTNPRFVLLIRDQLFVLLSVLRASAFVTNHRCIHCAYVLRHPPGTASAYDSKEKWEKSVYNVLNMDIFLTKMHGFATGGLYSPPGSMWGTFYYGWMRFISLLLDCWTKTPAYCHYKAWKSKDNF